MSNDVDLVRYTFILFVAETGLGSFLHGLKIPLSGHFLSLNQNFWLTRLTIKRNNYLEPYYASQVVSLLKTLSPAGKKLTPMLAISMQGFFFHLPLRVLGVNPISITLSGILLSLWAFLQPMLLYLIIFGRNLFDVADYYLDKLHDVISFVPEKLSVILTFLILVKILLAMLTTLLAFKISNFKEKEWEEKILKLKKSEKKKTVLPPLKGILKDLTRPLFLLTLILTALFFYFQEHSLSKTFWMLLRPLAVAIVVFSFLRFYPIEKFEKFLKKDSQVQRLFLKMIYKIKE